MERRHPPARRPARSAPSSSTTTCSAAQAAPIRRWPPPTSSSASCAPRGIQVAGSAGRADVAPDVPGLARVQSAPLRTIAVDVLTNSDDNAAELLLKELGAGVATPGTRDNGLAVVRNDAHGWGIDLATANLIDGSGLDRTNLASCDELLTVLHQRSTTRTTRVRWRSSARPARSTACSTTARWPACCAARPARSPMPRRCPATCRSRAARRSSSRLLLNAPGVDDDYLGTWGSLIDALATYPSGPTAAQLAPA